jgi:ribonuclease P protein component
MTETGLPKSSRLLSSQEFSAVFEKPDKRVSSKYMLILARRNSGETSRLGLVIAKKHIKLAVQRNRIKRIFRESFRAGHHQFDTIDLVFLARNGLDNLTSAEIRAHCDELLGQLLKRLSDSKKTGREK